MADAADTDSVLAELEAAPLVNTAPSDDVPEARDGALPSSLEIHLNDIERDILLQALTRHRFNRTAAGASLGLSLRQMRYRMARLGVMVDELEREPRG